MPSTVSEIFSAAGLRPAAGDRWGTPIPESGPGVYVVSLAADPDTTDAALPSAPIDRDRVAQLLEVRPELRLDGMRPDVPLLTERLQAFWLPDEVVLYIGFAAMSVRNRVGAYYRSPLGARRPHSDGWFLKTLAARDALVVHHAPCADALQAEHLMLEAFSDRVSPETRRALHDAELPIPFANREWPRGRRKEHGITGARGPLPSAPAPATAPAAADGTGAADDRAAPAGGPRRTQRVTAADLHGGRIRLPRASKALFPAEAGPVEVVLRGNPVRGEWDPGTGAKRERSGVLRVPQDVLDALVSQDEILVVDGRDTRVTLD